MRRSPVQYATALLAVAETSSAADMSAVVSRLRLVLRRAKASRMLPRILAAVEQMVREKRGVVRATVTTARPVAAPKLESMFKQILGQVDLELHHDPSLIGGAVVRIGDQRVDGSVKAMLASLRRTLAHSTNLSNSSTK